MRLFYHVNFINRGKEYRFDFSYIKNEAYNIYGSAEVLFLPDKKIIRFDADSNAQLDDIEKHKIVYNILKHVV